MKSSVNVDPNETCWTEVAAAKKPPDIVPMHDTANSLIRGCDVNPRNDSHKRSPDADVVLCSTKMITTRCQKLSMLTAHQDVLFLGILL